MTAEGYVDSSEVEPQISQRGSAATKDLFRMVSESLREGTTTDGHGSTRMRERRWGRGRGRKEFPKSRGGRPRLHRTRFLMEIGPALPEERRPV